MLRSNGNVELARKMSPRRESPEPETCASACSFVSQAGEALLCSLLPRRAFPIPAVAVGCVSGSPAPQLSSRVSDWDDGLGEATRDLLLPAQVGGEPRGWMRAASSRGHWLVGEELSSLSVGLWLFRLKGGTGGAMCLLDTGQRRL